VCEAVENKGDRTGLKGTRADDWPVAGSGLSRRAVHRLTENGYKTIGQVRAAGEASLQSIPGLGAATRAEISAFLNACRSMERNIPALSTASDLLEHILPTRPLCVLRLRYGLDMREPVTGPACRTLQQIAGRLGQTRERVRQVEDEGFNILRSCMAQVRLDPLEAVYRHVLAACGGAAGNDTIWSLRTDPRFCGTNPNALLYLLCDAGYGLAYGPGYFTTASRETVLAVEHTAIACLSRTPKPETLETLQVSLAEALGDACPDGSVITCILENHSRFAATHDGRYTLREDGHAALIEEVMQNRMLPLHYRAITQAVNRHMQPGSRQGAGRILNTLRKNARFRRVSSGFYTLTKP
jgi:hypothetical protein